MDGIGHFAGLLWNLSDDFLEFPELWSVVFGLFLLLIQFLLRFLVPAQELIILFHKFCQFIFERINFIIFVSDRNFRFGIASESLPHLLDFIFKLRYFGCVGLGDFEFQLLFGDSFLLKCKLELLDFLLILV